jgi:EAL domain-containing protein (putative c-di-GMP-specific phosphodiesterase class I)
LRTAYQPVVVVASGRIAGVEALLRWAHPSRGTVGAATLVPLAEQSGLITEGGRWVLERACIDRRRWQPPDGHAPIRIFVNASACQFMTAGFAATVAAVLSDTKTDPWLVTIEVTESVFVQDADRALVVLRELKRLGVVLALDDFGTGYSSLSYLKRFPVDVVKIDRSFIGDLDRDPVSRLIVGAVVGLAHGLGMSMVAEGVESREQYDEVVRLGCDCYQGFHFAHPMPSDDLDRLLVAEHAQVNNSS